MFKAARLNRDGGVLAAAVPAVIRKPELAFDSQKWRHPKRYGMISHSLPLIASTRRNDISAAPHSWMNSLLVRNCC